MKLSIMPVTWSDEYEEYTTDDVSMSDRAAFRGREFATLDEAVEAARARGLDACYVWALWDAADGDATPESVRAVSAYTGISEADEIHWDISGCPEFEKLVFP